MEDLILIRHGQSEGNIGLSDHPDCALTEPGLDQARRVGRELAQLDLSNFTALVSPYSRAQCTAQAISEATALTFQIDPEIREWGKECAISGITYPLESREELVARMRAFYERIRGGRYVLVSHAAPIAALLQVISGKPSDLSGDFWAGIGNCEPVRVRSGKPARWCAE